MARRRNHIAASYYCKKRKTRRSQLIAIFKDVDATRGLTRTEMAVRLSRRFNERPEPGSWKNIIGFTLWKYKNRTFKQLEHGAWILIQEDVESEDAQHLVTPPSPRSETPEGIAASASSGVHRGPTALLDGFDAIGDTVNGTLGISPSTGWNNGIRGYPELAQATSTQGRKSLTTGRIWDERPMFESLATVWTSPGRTGPPPINKSTRPCRPKPPLRQLSRQLGFPKSPDGPAPGDTVYQANTLDFFGSGAVPLTDSELADNLWLENYLRSEGS